MKYLLALIFCLSSFLFVHAQTEGSEDNVLITYTKKKTRVRINDKGDLVVNVSQKDLSKFKELGWVSYGDFGAKGNGKADDIDAIVATHAFANEQALKVKADEGATYYISGKERTAIIRTDTDFGTAAFIIDDTDVENRNAPVFMVSSDLQPFELEGLSSLKRNQNKIDVALPQTCLITVTNSNVKHYIRYGLNQNNGSDQTDIFIVDK